MTAGDQYAGDQYASAFIRAHRVIRIPDGDTATTLCVGMVDPADDDLRERLQRYHKGAVEVRRIEETELVARLSRLVGERFGGSAAGEAATSSEPAVDGLSETVPAVSFVNALLYDAVRAGASDVHLETGEAATTVRYRIDGVLHTVRRYERIDFRSVVSRLKVMSRVGAAERRRPQDGRFSFRAGEASYDVRTSFLPCDGGESVSVRLLGGEGEMRTLADLSMREPDRRALAALNARGGLTVVAGPTGCGKTTTVHALLRGLCDGSRKIVTVEDPVEYRLPGVTQVQVRRELDLDFDAVLRRALRHDPDVLMVGEIRDAETAALAVRAALSGHPVFSTVHTAEAASVDTRFANLGVPQPVLAEVRVAGIAQRLLRRVCPSCARQRPAGAAACARAAHHGVDLQAVRVGTGCRHCGHTGFRGRLGVFHVVTASYRSAGLAAEAWRAVARGETTPSEVARTVTPEGDTRET